MGCGVGDYAALLAAEICSRWGGRSGFLALEVVDGGNGVSEDQSRQIERCAETFAQTLEGCQRVLLHYAGYGYQKRGCPLWLVNGVRRWRRRCPDARLVTMFHERYAFGRPWQSSFWTSPLQKWIFAELARLSDVAVTNREENLRLLQRMRGGDQVWQMPVFSTVGEPTTCQALLIRPPRLALFGGAGFRRLALTRDLDDLRKFCARHSITEGVEIGPGDTPQPQLGLKWRKLGALPAAEVSRWLEGSRFGFMSYASTALEKSTIFAAYAAHGVVPVLPASMVMPDTLGVREGEHFLNARTEVGDPGRIGGQVHDWYQPHALLHQARLFSRLLKD